MSTIATVCKLVYMGEQIFISYSSKNKAIADAVCHKLEERKMKCWIAPRDILPGANYAEELINAIDNSKLFVLIFPKIPINPSTCFESASAPSPTGSLSFRSA